MTHPWFNLDLFAETETLLIHFRVSLVLSFDDLCHLCIEILALSALICVKRSLR